MTEKNTAVCHLVLCESVTMGELLAVHIDSNKNRANPLIKLLFGQKICSVFLGQTLLLCLEKLIMNSAPSLPQMSTTTWGLLSHITSMFSSGMSFIVSSSTSQHKPNPFSHFCSSCVIPWKRCQEPSNRLYMSLLWSKIQDKTISYRQFFWLDISSKNQQKLPSQSSFEPIGFNHLARNFFALENAIDISKGESYLQHKSSFFVHHVFWRSSLMLV